LSAPKENAPKVRSRGKIPNAPQAEPWRPTEWQDEDAYAVQAIMYGRASEEQQRRAMTFIVNNLCGTYDQSFRPPELDPDGRVTAFASGKRQVGLELVKFSKINIAALRSTQGAAPKEQP
jgi:hypothetical protein